MAERARHRRGGPHGSSARRGRRRAQADGRVLEGGLPPPLGVHSFLFVQLRADVTEASSLLDSASGLAKTLAYGPTGFVTTRTRFVADDTTLLEEGRMETSSPVS